MSIRENQLPIAESLAEGDKIRIVTSDGNSKSIDASAIGGGAVEKIKIGTCNGGGAVPTGFSYMWFSGGFDMQSSSLYDIIGEKTVIGVEVEYTATANGIKESMGLYSAYGSDGAVNVQTFSRNLEALSVEERKQTISIGVTGFLFGITAPGSAAVDLYAICM